MNNTQKTIKNSAISVTAQIVTLLLQFINRRVFVVFLDIEFLGYQTVFSNVFSILSVAELGIGSIISFQLYKEVVNKNQIEDTKDNSLLLVWWKTFTGACSKMHRIMEKSFARNMKLWNGMNLLLI